MPLPSNESRWTEGAELVRKLQEVGRSDDRTDLLLRFGQTMTAAYEDSDTVVEWWINRLPKKRAV